MKASSFRGKARKSNSMTPIFGLTKDQLLPIVDNIVLEERVKSFDVTVEHQVRGHYGYNADKVIPTLILTTQTDSKRKVSIFVKRFHEPGPNEAHHYANLQKHQAPIPRMYGSLTDSNQREVIFLEYLNPLHDVYPFHQFLAVVARRSTCSGLGCIECSTDVWTGPKT